LGLSVIWPTDEAFLALCGIKLSLAPFGRLQKGGETRTFQMCRAVGGTDFLLIWVSRPESIQRTWPRCCRHRSSPLSSWPGLWYLLNWAVV
jgi:hypothetical protein